jgi:hypothetical protein
MAQVRKVCPKMVRRRSAHFKMDIRKSLDEKSRRKDNKEKANMPLQGEEIKNTSAEN